MNTQTAIGLGKSLLLTLLLLLFIYPQQALSGVTLNVLEKNKVIQVSINTKDKRTKSNLFPEFKQTVAQENKPGKIQRTVEPSLPGFISFLHRTLNSLPVRIVLSVIFVFISLIYFIRRQEHKISASATKDDALINATIPPGFIPVRFTIKNLPEAEIIPLQQEKNTMTLLENTFKDEGYFSETGFIQEKTEHSQNTEQANEESRANVSLNSIEEIKFINEVSRSSRIDAFLKVTQSEHEAPAGTTSIEGLLENELANIQYDEKVDVFIEEFDQLISSLSQQTTILDKEPDELENLIQFKLSIHLIKVLSDMMQANYLKHFSQTIIEFLEDIVNGNAKMTSDILRRLHNVVRFCDQYISFLKNGNPVKAQV